MSFPDSSTDAADRDAALRRVLEDVAARRVTIDRAVEQIKALPLTQLQAASTLLGPALQRGRKMQSSAPLFAGGLMAIIGTIFIAVGIIASWKSIQLIGVSDVAQGRVVQMMRSGKGSKPVVKYSVDGRDFEVVGGVATSPPAFQVGDQVKVVYRIADPSDAVVDSFTQRWLMPLVFGGIGLLVALAGWGMLLSRLVARFFSRPSLDDAERFTVE